MEAIRGGHDEATVVTRLRVRASDIDPLTAQSRIAGLLRNVDAQPAGLPPAAVAFVRELRDPLPRTLKLNPRNLHPPPAWQRAFKVALDDAFTASARPMSGLVPATANAVVFADRSELLACLAIDWCETRLTGQWWWRSFLIRSEPQHVVYEMWQSNPAYVPAALQHLANRGRVIDFLSRLRGAWALELARLVAATFALNSLRAVLDHAVGIARHASSDAEESEASIAQPLNGSRTGRELNAITAPWRARVPECRTPVLSIEQQLLLGVALMLQREPIRARSAGFAHEVNRWLAGVSDLEASPSSSSHQGDQDRTSLTVSVQTEATNSEAAAADESSTRLAQLETLARDRLPQRGVELTAEPKPPASAQQTEHAPSDANARREERLPASLSTTDELPTEAGDGLDLATTADDDTLYTQLDGAPPAIEHSDSTQSAGEAAIETEYGGVFYLINLALYLGLYGDFTMPRQPGLELSIWDFVALTGRELIGPELETDPVWRLLGRLSGREPDEAIGDGFRPQGEWRMPAAWLEPFADGHLEAISDGSRLRVIHSGRFVVIDVPCATNSSAQLAGELAPYQEFGFAVSASRLRKDLGQFEFGCRYSNLIASNELVVWLGRLMPYVRARLRKAIGLTHDDDLSTLLCRRAARVWVTPTHVDISFQLADLPIEVRRAGLDRDPGWVPAAGKFITFYFE